MDVQEEEFAVSGVKNGGDWGGEEGVGVFTRLLLELDESRRLGSACDEDGGGRDAGGSCDDVAMLMPPLERRLCAMSDCFDSSVSRVLLLIWLFLLAAVVVDWVDGVVAPPPLPLLLLLLLLLLLFIVKLLVFIDVRTSGMSSITSRSPSPLASSR